MNVQGVNPVSRLMDIDMKEDGSAVDKSGQDRANFMDELKAKCMSNAVVTFLKGFPGFSDWWFLELDEMRRENIFIGIQIVILNAMNRSYGLPGDKVIGIRMEILSFFDQLPSFRAWREVTLGSTMRDRVMKQLDQYIYDELKR